MSAAVRGDDDVLALLNEMTGGEESTAVASNNPNHDGKDGSIMHPSSHSQQAAERLMAAHHLSPPSNPRVEIIRHRCHEKFKASFYDVFRSTCAPPSNNHNSNDINTAVSKRNQCIRSAIYPIWKSMPPHSVWERFQFSLKTLEGECVREAHNQHTGNSPWCRHDATHSAEQLLQQTICPTVPQIHAWIIAGQNNGTIWEPLLPVPAISSDTSNTELQQVNQRYRQGTLSLLQEEIQFQFRRSFKQQLGVGGKKPRYVAKDKNQPPLSLEKLFSSLKEMDEESVISPIQSSASIDKRDGKNAKKKAKKAKKEMKRFSDSQAIDEEEIDDRIKEEFILQTIFQSDPFKKLLQKLHKHFHFLAEDTQSNFLVEMQKCSNRLTVEEQSRSSSGGGRKRKKKNASNNMPKIAFVENDDGNYAGDRGNSERNATHCQAMVTYAGVSLRINETHKNKLHSLYQRTLQHLLNDDDEKKAYYLQFFPQLLFTILLRYDALEGAGLQSAIPSNVFRFLHERFGCEFECFASPFNCWQLDEKHEHVTGGQYGSAFGDTDALFGSNGSFFGIDFLRLANRPSEGVCFQANPPFGSEFIEKMCNRMHHFLDTEDSQRIPLMFIVFVPAWSESTGWKTLSSSPHVTKHLLLSQSEDSHFYTEGTQHRRRVGDSKEGGSHRIASFDTSIFFLQNDAGRERWHISDVDERMLKAAFAMHPLRDEEKKEDNNVRGGKKAKIQNGKQASRKGPDPSHTLSSNTTQATVKGKKKMLDNEVVRTTQKKKKVKKKKLMAGGNDELSILASIGMYGEKQSHEDNRPKLHPRGRNGGRNKKRRHK
mmetsp:Transcript_24921/g.60003  ORF Transcript_24921/g.60003 Transcript_24921/m.60003 type:complete len:823 (-) Transcript_24921:280-2748(-)